mgnify:CR=1 FL=1
MNSFERHAFWVYLNQRRTTYARFLMEVINGGYHCLDGKLSGVFFEGSSGVYERGILWPDDILSLIKI